MNAQQEELVLANLSWVRTIAYKKFGRVFGNLQGDLIQEGVIGLMEAAEQFNPERSTKFMTYAQYRIMGHMSDFLRNQDCMSRGERRRLRAGDTGVVPVTHVYLDDPEEFTDIPVFPDTYDGRAERVRDAIMKLSPRDRDIVEKHFYEYLTCEEIGSTLGLTTSTVSVRLRGILKHLRVLLRDVR